MDFGSTIIPPNAGAEFPKMLYKAGGPKRLHGIAVSTRVVQSEEEEEALHPEGWRTSPAKADKAAAPQLDHDGNGVAGGSEAQPATEALKALRADYQALTGKKPFNGWDEATLRAKLETLKEVAA